MSVMEQVAVRSPRISEEVILSGRLMRKTLWDFAIRCANTLRTIFLMYVGLVVTGGYAFSRFEDDSWWNGSWWAIITSLSIGYGDIYPVTTGGRIVGIIVGVGGILLISPFIIGLIVKYGMPDFHQFTDCEQRLVVKCLNFLVSMSLVLFRNQRTLAKNQMVLGDMLVAIAESTGANVNEHRAKLKDMRTPPRLVPVLKEITVINRTVEEERRQQVA